MATGLGTTIRRKREKVINIESTSATMPMDPHKAKVWNYYTKLGGAYVECNVCRKQLSFHNSTTTMREHLVRWHSSRSSSFPQIGEEQDFPSQEGAPKRPRQALTTKDMCLSDSESRTVAITDLVLDMICQDLHPLSVVEDKGFGLLFGFLEPNFSLPSPIQLSGLLWHRYTVMKQQLKCRLLEAQTIVLSVESWTSRSNHLCQGITASVIDGDWQLARYMLETQHLHPSKVEDGLVGRLYSAAAEFGLPSSVVSCVVHDRSTSMLAYGPALKEIHGWDSVCCAAHILQTCVREGLDVHEVRETLSAVRGLISYFDQDAKAACSLEDKLETMNKARPVLDTETCWISTLQMCQNLLDVKWALLSMTEERMVQNLPDQHWKLLQDLVPVLKTVWISTVFLQEEQNASISSLMPCVHGILNAFAGFSEDGSSAVKAAVNQMQREMCRHWDVQNEAKLLASPWIMASFLDPRFKELRFLKPATRGELHSRVLTLLSQIHHPPEAHLGPSVTCKGADKTLQLCLQGEGCTSTVYDILLGKDPTESMPEVRQQLDNYIVEPICKRSMDPLIWWKTNHHRFPTLAKLAHQYLTIPATAVPPEHAFSARHSTLHQRRAVLDEKLMDSILFVQQNAEPLDLPKND
ncbi:E3 SUMO-protein ligase ZBED1-like [Pelodytes ibericus]